MVLVKQAIGVATEDGIGDEEGFDGGKATSRIKALLLATWISGDEAVRDAAQDQGCSELLLHLLCIAPGAVEKKKSVGTILARQGRSVYREEDVAGTIWKLFSWIGKKMQVISCLQATQAAFFQIFAAVAQNKRWRKCKHFFIAKL